MDSPLTADDIPWRPSPEPLSFQSQVDIECAVLRQRPDETAAWIGQLLLERQQFQTGLHVCMDACHDISERYKRLEERYHRILREFRVYRRIDPDLGVDALKHQTYAE